MKLETKFELNDKVTVRLNNGGTIEGYIDGFRIDNLQLKASSIQPIFYAVKHEKETGLSFMMMENRTWHLESEISNAPMLLPFLYDDYTREFPLYKAKLKKPNYSLTFKPGEEVALSISPKRWTIREIYETYCGLESKTLYELRGVDIDKFGNRLIARNVPHKYLIKL